MKRLLFILLMFLVSHPAMANVFEVFREEDGHTNWQYVANFSSSIFIIALSFTVLRLFLSRRQAHRYNLELEAIRNQLEQRVQERTATLDESNRLLQESNAALEVEIAQHRETSNLLRSSEAYINNILHSMPLMLVGVNSEMQITQWNHRAEEITAIPSGAALGQDLWKTYPVITVTPQQVKEVLTNNQKLTIKQSQRGQYHFDITIYPLMEQIETGVVILIDDVTQRILTENMLIQRDKMSSMGELAATMAHNINSPLQAIIRDIEGALAIDNAATDADRLRLQLEDARVECQQASALISNLLEFASNQGGEKKLAEVSSIIDRTIELAEDILSLPSGTTFTDITIIRDYADNLPQVPCYPSEFQQVILSLLSHACHSLDDVDRVAHKPTINIQVSEFYDSLWVKVNHNGKGLSYEEQQSIFEPFFSDTTSGAEYDASKRLSFSHFIITELHRGEMAVTSDIDVGTTFHLQLQLDHSDRKTASR